jgi:hypothetical protein
VPAYPTPDECFARLHRAGWSVGEASFLTPAGEVWQVSGSNGEKLAEGPVGCNGSFGSRRACS